MRFNLLAFICAAAMLASFFLPWFDGPLADSVTPWKAFEGRNSDEIFNIVKSAPPQGLAFLATLAMAAIYLLLSLIRLDSALMAFLTGIGPIALVGWILYATLNGGSLQDYGITGADVMELARSAAANFALGAWAWLGGGALLVLLSLIDPGRRSH